MEKNRKTKNKYSRVWKDGTDDSKIDMGFTVTPPTQPPSQPFPENAPIPGISQLGLILLSILALSFGLIKINKKN